MTPITTSKVQALFLSAAAEDGGSFVFCTLTRGSVHIGKTAVVNSYLSVSLRVSLNHESSPAMLFDKGFGWTRSRADQYSFSVPMIEIFGITKILNVCCVMLNERTLLRSSREIGMILFLKRNGFTELHINNHATNSCDP